jgi:hypothetical protein
MILLSIVVNSMAGHVARLVDGLQKRCMALGLPEYMVLRTNGIYFLNGRGKDEEDSDLVRDNVLPIEVTVESLT